LHLARGVREGIRAMLAQRDGTWPRLKACGNPDRRWAFYDRSHSRVGAWCDMNTCGNRIKNRKLRQRQRQRQR
jgi:predicted RNA-binding Zn ribbon-like protein